MKKLVLTAVLGFAAAAAGFAQDVSGIWQGTLKTPQRDLRVVFKISKDQSELKTSMYSIDQGGASFGGTVTAQAATVKITIAALGGTFEGKLDSEGKVLSGTWSQGPNGIPLELKHVTADEAWPIPEPVRPKTMPADAKPVFDVATIKPSPPEARGSSILVGRGGSNLFTTTNTTLQDLVIFAYGLHPRQVSGGPSWCDSDKFDVTGKPDREGIPNVTQLRMMLQKLLTERFQLAFHREKRELSVYAITVAKTGSKLTQSDANAGILPGFGGPGRGSVVVRNSTMPEFAEFLQSRVLDRPVVDQSGLPARYDFTLKWTPDTPLPGSGPDGASAAPPAPPENGDAPPDLFAAFQQQLGLKIESTKAPVDVLVIDKVAKPSDN